MDIQAMKKEVIEEINQKNESGLKSSIHTLLTNLIHEQETIKTANERIETIQELLRELETPKVITEDILS